eukprot:1137303-Pelagomonas_calceolata.AAC.5
MLKEPSEALKEALKVRRGMRQRSFPHTVSRTFHISWFHANGKSQNTMLPCQATCCVELEKALLQRQAHLRLNIHPWILLPATGTPSAMR